MRLLLATLTLAVPALAAAQDRIPEDVLAEQNRSCVAECAETRDQAFCVATCDCVSREIGENWTLEEYEDRAARLGAEDTAVRDELNQIAAYCMQEAEQAQ